MSRLRPLTRGRRFVLVSVLALAGVASTARLGMWQLDRAAQKNEAQASLRQQEALPLLDAGLLRNGTSHTVQESLLHRRVVLQGRWLARHTVYLDNRQMDGRAGFYVVTPLAIEPGFVVLVQRGFIARNFEDRTRLQPVITAEEAVQVTGRVEAAPARLYELGSTTVAPGTAARDPAGPGGAARAGSSAIRQNLDLLAFRQETGLPLADFSIVQTGAESDGLLRHWPEPARGVERHYGYAFQWFGLSALIAFLYVWFQFIRRAPAAFHDATR